MAEGGWGSGWTFLLSRWSEIRTGQTCHETQEKQKSDKDGIEEALSERSLGGCCLVSSCFYAHDNNIF